MKAGRNGRCSNFKEGTELGGSGCLTFTPPPRTVQRWAAVERNVSGIVWRRVTSFQQSTFCHAVSDGLERPQLQDGNVRLVWGHWMIEPQRRWAGCRSICVCVRVCVCIWDSLHHILDSASLVHWSTRTEGQVQPATRVQVRHCGAVPGAEHEPPRCFSPVVPSCLCLGVWSAHLHKVDMLNECARERACCVGSGNPVLQREQMAALTKVKLNTQAQQPPLKTHGLLWATLLLRTETLHHRVLNSARNIR